MDLFVPLFAAEDWIKVAGTLLVIVVTALRYLLAAKPQPPQARPVARPAMPVPQQGNAPHGPTDAAQLNNEVEEFLKRATQRRREKSRREAEAAGKAQQRKRPVKRLPDTSNPRAPLDSDSPRVTESVAAHVQKHLSNEQFGERAAHLTDDLTRADQQREQHLKDVFSHQVGRLAGDTAGLAGEAVADTKYSATDVAAVVKPSSAPAAMAAGLTTLLGDGQNLRQAVVMSEILRRPEDRWE